jgi:hypothetical protein
MSTSIALPARAPAAPRRRLPLILSLLAPA